MTALRVASLLVVISTNGFGGVAAPTPAPSGAREQRPVAAKAKAHGIALSGRISRVDPAKKLFGVRDEAGRETPLSWTAATKVTGGELKVGETVTLRYLDKDAKHIATSIQVGPRARSSPAAATPIPVSPTATDPRSNAFRS